MATDRRRCLKCDQESCISLLEHTFSFPFEDNVQTRRIEDYGRIRFDSGQSISAVAVINSSTRR